MKSMVFISIMIPGNRQFSSAACNDQCSKVPSTLTYSDMFWIKKCDATAEPCMEKYEL